ncbi:MAG: pentapeptide repeat-containing protein [Cyanobacteria bacterium P01_D01_bin.1]
MEPDYKHSVGSSAEMQTELLNDFQKIYAVKKPIERAIALHQKALAFEKSHGLSVGDYARLFEVYITDIHTADIIEKINGLTHRLEPIVSIFQNLASLAIIVSAFQLVTGFREQRSQIITTKWQVLASDIKFGGAKREALEFLHDQGELLSGVELVGVQLSGLNLPDGASLQEANFSESNLYQAYFQGANLYRSKFSSPGEAQTNLEEVNFRDADLRQADFRGAYLENACFTGANLEGANFDGAYLGDADFRGARFLERSQVENAAPSAAPAIFDQTLTETKAELDDQHTSIGCRIKPRNKAWWDSIF